MRSRIPQLLFVGAGIAAFFAATIEVVAQSTPSRSLLALSKRNHTLAIVDRTRCRSSLATCACACSQQPETSCWSERGCRSALDQPARR
jgi:hypothetical protein